MFDFVKIGYDELLIKLGVDAATRKNVDRVVKQMRKLHGSWVNSPTDAELKKIFPPGWEKKNPSWQTQFEKSQWLKDINTEAMNRKEFKKNPFATSGARPSGGKPPPYGWSPEEWADYAKKRQQKRKGAYRRAGASWDDPFKEWDKEWRKSREEHKRHTEDFKRRRAQQGTYESPFGKKWQDDFNKRWQADFRQRTKGVRVPKAPRGPSAAATAAALLGLTALAGGGAYAAYKAYKDEEKARKRKRAA